MTNTTYVMRTMAHVDGHGDVGAPADAGTREFIANLGSLFGKELGGAQRRLTSFLVFESEGNPIPRTGKVTDVEINFVSRLALSSAFSADTSLLVDDGKWTQPGSGTAQWVGHPDSHLDFQLRAEDSGGSALRLTDIGTSVDGSVTVGETDDLWLTNESLAQTFTADSTGTIETTKIVIRRAGAVGDFPVGGTFHPVYYDTLKQDGTDDRPDIAGGELGKGGILGAADITTSFSVISFDHTDFFGVPVDVVSGTRYAVVFERNWSGNDTPGAYLQWGFMANTTEAPLYPNGSPSSFGIPEAFNKINYLINVDLPSRIHLDGVTENVAPFGSVSRDSPPNFPAISGTASFSSDGITEVFQEYFNRPDYNPEIPIGLCFGPGDAANGEGRVILTMDFDNADPDERTKIDISWRDRKYNIT